jgi:uncharacterized delta-60 repeat protein
VSPIRWLSRARPRAGRRPVSPWRPAVERLEERTLLTAGVLDPTFAATSATPGSLLLEALYGSQASGQLQGELASAIAVQKTDGKIVVAGTIGLSSVDAGVEPHAFAVARFNADGTLDTTFDAGGTVPGTQTVGNFLGGTNPENDNANAVAIQGDGKILLAGGASTNTSGQADMVVVRLNSDGTLDTTFNAQGSRPGTVVLNFASGDAVAFGIAVEPVSGKIVVVGTSGAPAQSQQFAVAQLNADGSLDKTFNPQGSTPGELTLNNFFGTGKSLADVASGVALRPADGKILVGGEVDNGAAGVNEVLGYGVARLNTDGSLDTTFHAQGLVPGTSVVPGFSAASTSPESLALAGDGKIAVTGDGGSLIAVGLLNGDGTLDTSFNPGGSTPGVLRLSTPFFANGFDSGQAVVVQSDGKVVVGGSAFDPSSSASSLELVRFNADGSLDPTFNPAGSQPGRQVLGFAGKPNPAAVTSLALQPADGKLLVAGSLLGGNNQSVLARFATASPSELQFTSAQLTVNENGGSVQVTVTRTGDASAAVSVGVAVAGGTAVPGVDFTFTAPTLQWGAGDSSPKSFTIPILNDGTVDGNQTIVLQLQDPTGGATLGDPVTATVTIDETNTPPPPPPPPGPPPTPPPSGKKRHHGKKPHHGHPPHPHHGTHRHHGAHQQHGHRH